MISSFFIVVVHGYVGEITSGVNPRSPKAFVIEAGKYFEIENSPCDFHYRFVLFLSIQNPVCSIYIHVLYIYIYMMPPGASFSPRGQKALLCLVGLKLWPTGLGKPLQRCASQCFLLTSHHALTSLTPTVLKKEVGGAEVEQP